MKKICIADDELYFRFTAGLALKRRGYAVTEAGDGDEAFEQFRAARQRGEGFDLLVTDVQMPPSGGLALLDRLYDEGIHQPVLVVSGYFDEKLFAALIKRRLLDYLEKPLSLEELVSRAEQLLQSHEDLRTYPAAT